MKRTLKLISYLLFLTPIVACGQKHSNANQSDNKHTQVFEEDVNSIKLDTATFAAGCFWCVEAQFKLLDGVEDVISGYTGGHVENPTYAEVCTGTTGHAEACNILFNAQKISFDELLKAFFTAHDPTQLNKQGNDLGTQYRSAIFYHNEKQRKLAEYYIQQLNKEHAYPSEIVTEVSALTVFYPAENYHQDYYNNNQNKPYCKLVIQPKMDKFKKVFNDKLKKNQKQNEMKNPYYSRIDTSKVTLSDETWKEILPSDLYQIARKQGTEMPFTGKYNKFSEKGTYFCSVCGNKLFRSDAKFESSCGWPSFFESVENSVVYKKDLSHGMNRIEVECGRCNSHLGHIFNDGPAPTYKRYCMNSLSLDFVADTK